MNLNETTLPSRIGVIGDIHAEAHRLRSTLEFFARQGLSTILCTGDIVDGSQSVDECVELLKEYRVQTVCGNHEQWFLANQLRNLPGATQVKDISLPARDYLLHLPVEREYKTMCGDLLLCHGIGKKTMGKVQPDDEGYALEANWELQELVKPGRLRYMINGHTHRKMLRTFDGLTVINAGTLICYETSDFLTIDLKEGYVQFYTLAHDLQISFADQQHVGCVRL
jgi:predicted phosphodiesterase